MTTAIKENKTKTLGRKVPSKKPANSKNASNQTTQKKDEVGLGVLLNSHLPRSFDNPADVDAHIRWLRDE